LDPTRGSAKDGYPRILFQYMCVGRALLTEWAVLVQAMKVAEMEGLGAVCLGAEYLAVQDYVLSRKIRAQSAAL